MTALGGWYALRERKSEVDVKLPQTPGKKALAVFFFENRSGAPELDWLREGLADMLIANFSRSPKLSVLSRQQLAALLDRLGRRRDTQISLEEALEIARKTQAEAIVLGSFAQLGEQVRLDAQLHDAHGASPGHGKLHCRYARAGARASGSALTQAGRSFGREATGAERATGLERADDQQP